jgi:hypothetical protein
MTEQERTELIKDAKENEELYRLSEISQAMWSIKGLIKLVRQEMAYLDNLGVTVDFLSIKGPKNEFEAEHADMKLYSGSIGRVAKAFKTPVRTWCTVTPSEKQVTVEDLTIRGKQS